MNQRKASWGKSLALLSACGAYDARAERVCRLGDRPMSASDVEEKKASGVLSCRDEKGDFAAESTYVKGQRIGRQVSIDYQGRRVEKTINAQDQKEGVERIFAPDGKLYEIGHYKQGQAEGLQVRYQAGAKVSSMAWFVGGYEQARLTWNERGQLNHVNCGDKAFFPEQAQICGFRGENEVRLFDGRGKALATETYRNGKVVASQELSGGRFLRSEKDLGQRLKEIEIASSKSRKVVARFRVQLDANGLNPVLDGESRTYFEDGKPRSLSTWKAGDVVTETVYFQNGNLDTETKATGKTVHEKIYRDDGSLWTENVFEAGRYEGLHYGARASRIYEEKSLRAKQYDVTGKLSLDQEFDAQGRLVRQTEYGKDGKGISTEFHPDGSRKLPKKGGAR